MAETEQRYLSVVTRGCYLGVPWHNEVAVYCSDRHAFTNLWIKNDKKPQEAKGPFTNDVSEGVTQTLS